MRRTSKEPASRFCWECNHPVVVASDTVYIVHEGKRLLFHKLCHSLWLRTIQRRLAGEAKMRARQEATIERRRQRRTATVKVENLHTQIDLKVVPLRDLLVEVADRIAAKVEGLERASIDLRTLVEQLLRGSAS